MLFEIALREVAAKWPSLNVRQALKLAERLEAGEGIGTTPPPTNPADLVALAQWAALQPEVVQYIDGAMINAIKELRAAYNNWGGYCGLKEAKEAAEYLKYSILGHTLLGHTPSAWGSKYAKSSSVGGL